MSELPWASSAPRPVTVAESIERTLACEILRGTPAAGARLPSVRALAARFEVTVPTIQRVVARLEALGLVEARQGSGVEVLDPQRAGGLAVMPLWFEAFADDTPRAAAVLADFLELRRVFAVHLASRHRAALLGVAPRLAVLAAQLVASTDLETTARTDLHFSRTLLEASGNVAALRMFHTVERLVLEVPYVAEALYGDRGAHHALMAELAAAVATSVTAAGLAERMDQRMTAFDNHVVARFQALLEQRSTPSDGR